MTDHVRLRPVQQLRVSLGADTIVDTAQAYAVHEGQLAVRYYVPRAEVRAECSDTSDIGSCPWKGKWRHIDVSVAGRKIEKAAWAYYEPTPVCEPIRDFLSFYANNVEVTEIE
jgi:uncharacterized protein (DUF427 family)